jgi:hypothetical protein
MTLDNGHRNMAGWDHLRQDGDPSRVAAGATRLHGVALPASVLLAYLTDDSDEGWRPAGRR